MKNRIKEALYLFAGSGIKKEDVAKAAGVTLKKLEAFISHKEEPDYEMCVSIARLFETDSLYIQGCNVIQPTSWRYHWEIAEEPSWDNVSGFIGVARIYFKGEEQPLDLSICEREWNRIKYLMNFAESDRFFVTAYGNRIALVNRVQVDHIDLVSDDIEDLTEEQDRILPETFRTITRDIDVAGLEDNKELEVLLEGWDPDRIEALNRIDVKRVGENPRWHVGPDSYDFIAELYREYLEEGVFPCSARALIVEDSTEAAETIYPFDNISYALFPTARIEQELLLDREEEHSIRRLGLEGYMKKI